MMLESEAGAAALLEVGASLARSGSGLLLAQAQRRSRQRAQDRQRREGRSRGRSAVGRLGFRAQGGLERTLRTNNAVSWGGSAQKANQNAAKPKAAAASAQIAAAVDAPQQRPQHQHDQQPLRPAAPAAATLRFSSQNRQSHGVSRRRDSAAGATTCSAAPKSDKQGRVAAKGNCKRTTWGTCGKDGQCESDPKQPCEAPNKCVCQCATFGNTCKCMDFSAPKPKKAPPQGKKATPKKKKRYVPRKKAAPRKKQPAPSAKEQVAAEKAARTQKQRATLTKTQVEARRKADTEALEYLRRYREGDRLSLCNVHFICESVCNRDEAGYAARFYASKAARQGAALAKGER